MIDFVSPRDHQFMTKRSWAQDANDPILDQTWKHVNAKYC
jgi:hypothetical protein